MRADPAALPRVEGADTRPRQGAVQQAGNDSWPMNVIRQSSSAIADAGTKQKFEQTGSGTPPRFQAIGVKRCR